VLFYGPLSIQLLLPIITSSIKWQICKGINFASSKLLRFSIAILGITISAAVWLKLGIIWYYMYFDRDIFAFFLVYISVDIY